MYNNKPSKYHIYLYTGGSHSPTSKLHTEQRKIFLHQYSAYTAPLRHVNIEVACLDKPSKPWCRQASYEPGMGC